MTISHDVKEYQSVKWTLNQGKYLSCWVLPVEETDLPAKKSNLNVDKARCLQLIVYKSLKMPAWLHRYIAILAKLKGHKGNFSCCNVGSPDFVKEEKVSWFGGLLVDFKKEYVPVWVVNLVSDRQNWTSGINVWHHCWITVPIKTFIRENCGRLGQRTAWRVAAFLVYYYDVFTKGSENIGRPKGVQQK